jgi:hypothetical protein
MTKVTAGAVSFGTLVAGAMLALASLSTQAATFPRAVPPQAETMVTVQATPNAVCQLGYEDASFKSRRVQFDADDQGVVRIFVTAHAKAQPIAVNLECSAEDGQVTTHTLELHNSALDQLPAKPNAQSQDALPPSTAKIRPALEGDPMVLSNQELIARGYPPRPDPVRQVARYSRWLKIVSTPFKMVNARTVPHPGKSFGPLAKAESAHVDAPTLPLPPPGSRVEAPTLPLPPPSPEKPQQSVFNLNSNNWSGDYVTNPATQFYLVEADWNVPTVVLSDAGYADAAEWVGLDNAGNDLVQSGSDSESTSFFFWTFTNYWMWIESLPAAPGGVPGFSIAPGDSVSVDIFLADQNGQTWFSNGWWGTLTPADNNVWFMVYDFTQGQSFWGTLPTPAAFSGSSAEFILERATINGGLAQLADFALASMSNGWYADANYGEYDFWPVACQGQSTFDGTNNYINMVSGSDLLDFVITTSGYSGGPCNLVWFWTNWY